MKFLDAGVLLSVLLLLLSHEVKSDMTEKQLQSLLKMTRSVCQPKTKVTNELIAAMHQGEFVQDRTLMCYMECCLRTAKVTKDGKLDVAGLTELAKTIPVARREPTMNSLNACKNSGTTIADKCEASFDIYKCMYESNPPEDFFLP